MAGASPVAVGLADAVKAKDDRQTALVQSGGKALGNKEQVALHQPDRNRVTGCFEDAEAGCLGNGLLAAALLLFCLECRIRRGLLFAGVVDGAFGIGTDGADFAFLRAFGDDGLGGVLAGLVLRPVALLLVRGLLGANLDVLVARQGGAAFGRRVRRPMRFEPASAWRRWIALQSRPIWTDSKPDRCKRPARCRQRAARLLRCASGNRHKLRRRG